MPAQKFNLRGEYRIEQGTTYQLLLTITDPTVGGVYDLTGASCSAQVREKIDSTTYTSFSYAIDVALGTILLTLTDTQTSAFSFIAGVWDCELTESDGVVTRLLEGTVQISKEVTR